MNKDPLLRSITALLPHSTSGTTLPLSHSMQAKSKKLLWRVNKGIVKDLLPQEPLDVPIDPWWVVHVVNVGEAEFRQLAPEELQVRCAGSTLQYVSLSLSVCMVNVGGAESGSLWQKSCRCSASGVFLCCLPHAYPPSYQSPAC